MNQDSSPRHPVEELAEEFVARSRRGEQPAIAEYMKRYPDLATDIEELFPALMFLENCGQSAPGLSTDDFGRLGDYRLVREVGRGGMGIVYEAVQESLGRRVALKVLPAQTLPKPTWIDRFQREAAAAARLHHTNIVPVYGVGSADGHHFFAMQFIDGESLRDMLATAQDWSTTATRRSKTEPAITPGDASTAAFSKSAPAAKHSYFRAVAEIGVQVADALAYAHAQGILHRDIKPGNLLRDRQGIIWVTDFGLAKVEGADDLTATGDLVGTLRYMPPERFQGKEDARSDVYSLGLTLYELATRRPAFDQTDRTQLMHQLMHDTPPPPRQVERAIPRDLETIIQKAMDREPARRYTCAGELADDLRRFLADMPVQARRSSPLERVRRWCSRNPMLAALMTTSACMLVAVAVVSLVAYVRTSSALDNEKKARGDAEQSEINAHTAKQGETLARQDAEKDRDAALERLYCAKMNLVHRAWSGGEMDLALKVQRELVPQASQKDFRGWEWYFVRAHERRVVQTLDLEVPGIAGMVLAAAFSPNGQWLAADNGRRKVLIFDVKTKQILHELPHALSVHRLAWSPDSRRLAVSPFNSPVHVWDPATGLLSQSLQPIKFGGDCHGMTWSPDSKRLAMCFGKNIFTCDAENGATIASWAGGFGPMAWSPDGGRLAVAGKDRVISIWDLSKQVVQDRLEGHARDLTALVWHPRNGRLASASADGTARIWDIAAKRSLFTLTHPGEVNDVAWNTDGDRLATVCMDRALRVWDADAGQLEQTLRNYHGMATAVSWHPEGRLLVTASTDNRLNIWDIAASRQAWHGAYQAYDNSSLPSPFQSHYRSADGKREVHLDRKRKEFKVVDVASKKEVRALPVGIDRLAWSPTNRHLAWLAPGGMLRCWDDEREEERTLQAGRTESMAWSRDGRLIAAWNADAVIEIFDLASGKSVRSIEAREKNLVVHWSPRGDYLLTAGAEQRARIWNIGSGQVVGAHPIGATPMSQGALLASWRPDHRQMALRFDKQGLRLIDTATWQESFTLRAHTDDIVSLAWSPDGDRLASLGVLAGKAQIVLWNPRTGLETWAFSFSIPAYSAARLAWSPDGRRLTCETLKGAYSWDAAAGYEIR